jgi:Arc/MetJ-type ribon-helix-helix transcriptional regulator
MTIQLPDDLESSIRAEVLSGHFASEDDLVAIAVRDYLRRKQEHAVPKPPAPSDATTAPAYKPIWEVAEEIRKRIPAEEWTKLPTDGAEQIDHYIYGSPKRPTP